MPPQISKSLISYWLTYGNCSSYNYFTWHRWTEGQRHRLIETKLHQFSKYRLIVCPALCSKSEVTLVNNMYVRLSPVEEHHLVEISSTGSIDRTIVHRALSTKESSRLFSPFSLSSAVLLCFNYYTIAMPFSYLAL